ncbi:MAG: glycosyl hydrolase family 18 protein [Treponema sp.]|nr:glycosyl hydrolase family 18 protein [Treponema sp.]
MNKTKTNHASIVSILRRPRLGFFLAGMAVIVTTGCHSAPAGAAEFVTAQPVLRQPGQALPVSYFREVWGYLVVGREFALDPSLPITDIAYFGANVNIYGRLVGVPDFRNLAAFRGRTHLVAACTGRALSYFVLREGSVERQNLIRDLLEASRPFDGLQINFEYVPPGARASYHSFLRELRQGLGDRMLTVAIVARTRTLANDVYDYATIAGIVDRILVMAYDEHWSTSAPGPIASMGWSYRVARHSLDVIGPDSLIMGLPFYGRSWGHVNPSRAHIYDGIQELIREHNVREIRRVYGIPTFTYEIPVTVTVYFEDEVSLATRLEMYKAMGVRSVGFWRLGQETLAIWQYIRLEGESP